MRHEEASDAIYKVREWFGGLSKDAHVDAKVARIIDSILEAKQLSDRLHDLHHDQENSTKLLWQIVEAVDINAIRKAIDEASGIEREAEERLVR